MNKNYVWLLRRDVFILLTCTETVDSVWRCLPGAQDVRLTLLPLHRLPPSGGLWGVSPPTIHLQQISAPWERTEWKRQHVNQSDGWPEHIKIDARILRFMPSVFVLHSNSETATFKWLQSNRKNCSWNCFYMLDANHFQELRIIIFSYCHSTRPEPKKWYSIEIYISLFQTHPNHDSCFFFHYQLFCSLFSRLPDNVIYKHNSSEIKIK